MALTPAQLSGLWRAKLRALARDHLDCADGLDHELGWGAGLESSGHLVALIENHPGRALAQALVWADRLGAVHLDLIVDQEHGGLVARRAALFKGECRVWAESGGALNIAEPTPLESQKAPILEQSISELFDVPQVSIIIEHGWVTGEVRGLEVARVSGEGEDQRVDVGVGAYDQGAFATMNPDLTSRQALESVVAQVLESRTPTAPAHPLNRLVRERWIRSDLVEDAAKIGLSNIVAVEGPNPRTGIHDISPAFAWAETERTVVACSVGIDLELVPAALDVAARQGAESILLVVPERDRHGATLAAAALSLLPIKVAIAHEPWVL